MPVAHRPAKPLLIYDGDCTFCRHWVARWQSSTGDRVAYLPSQDPSIAAQYPEIPATNYRDALQLIEPSGAVLSGAAAALRTLAYAPRCTAWWWVYRHIPGMAWVMETVYGFIARHRSLASGVTRFLWGRSVAPPDNRRTRWLFLRLLGLVYLIAFASLWLQIDGLIGSRGIMPAAMYMDALRGQSLSHNGWLAYWLDPTLCWISASNGFLHGLAGGGVVLALLVIAGVATGPALALLWLGYLSLSLVSQPFLGYQWDGLLLETGLLAIFFAPRQWLPRLSRETPPSAAMLFLLRWLLFRLVLSSGVVKLVWHDPTWRNLTALTVHYETQPLPTWIAWYAHQLPDGFHRVTCGIMFVIELGAPFLIFAPRRLRFAAASAIGFLMVLIALTGNYGFFNLLTLVLCVLLLDDRLLQRLGRTIARREFKPLPAVPRPAWRRWITVPLAAIVFLLTGQILLQTCRTNVGLPAPLRVVQLVAYQSLQPLQSFNSYGLFANMTTARPEIIIEGSRDGIEWRTYEFKYKPGNPGNRPRFVQPHQPRLDWQLWFEALRPPGNPSPWFLNFCVRLLEGEPAVLNLMATNPFPAAPPQYVRAMRYDYRFSEKNSAAAPGDWWRREPIAVYSPALSLRRP